MAHELGNLVIPWHTGIKIDDGASSITSEISYANLEREANRFAAELLIPSTYTRNIVSQSANLARAQKEICNRLKVSPHATAMQIINTFPSGVLYSAVENEVIVHSGKTKGTSAKIPQRNQSFDEDVYPSAIKKSSCKFNDTVFYWWEMVPDLSANEVQNTPDWRQLLDEIVRL